MHILIMNQTTSIEFPFHKRAVQIFHIEITLDFSINGPTEHASFRIILYKQNVFVAYLNSVSVFFIAKSLGLTVFTFSRRKKNICIYHLFGIIGASTNFYLICNRFLFHKFNYNMMSNQYICFICCSHVSFIGSFVVQLITVP